MKPPQKKIAVLIFSAAVFFCVVARSQSLDQIGVTLLREVTTNVDGSGIRVAQPEAGYDQVTNWEVNPGTVGHPPGFLTYLSTSGSTTNFPNSLSSESSHADSVGGNFYGISSGVATNAAHVDNYDANYFYDNIAATFPTNINDPVANQSFIFCQPDYSHYPVSMEQMLDSQYDDYAAEYKILFVSGAGNGGPTNQAQVYPSATCYNGIGVAAYGGSSCTGPTLDNGRAKPDITAPASETSFSTPYVAGAATVLMQAALRGDGGSDTNSAADIRTIKCLLLNGAIKPADWTNVAPSPLDTRYGAGVLNVFNSYKQLTGGKHGYSVSGSVPRGDPHPPPGGSGVIGVGAVNGWDSNAISSSTLLFSTNDGVNHYYFDMTNASGNAAFTATATLVWNRQQNQTGINNLDLFLYDRSSSNLVAASVSVVDNVEHIFIPQLPPGRYDLQVLKNAENSVSDTETYALAWEFFSSSLNTANSGTNLALTWPVYPAGFFVEATTNLIPPVVWETNDVPASIVTNGQNCILLDPTNADEFFRLRRP